MKAHLIAGVASLFVAAVFAGIILAPRSVMDPIAAVIEVVMIVIFCVCAMLLLVYFPVYYMLTTGDACGDPNEWSD